MDVPDTESHPGIIAAPPSSHAVWSRIPEAMEDYGLAPVRRVRRVICIIFWLRQPRIWSSKAWIYVLKIDKFPLFPESSMSSD